jgi:3'-phosphoadenosine 5'-phosphosulfate sulfotransferase (PAPS reductase)/FAD synthetase
MKHIASCSFGKDSIAAIITRLEHGEPVDLAVYCRIMFNATISAELPAHEEWIHSYAIPELKSRYGIETAVVQPKKTYCEQFYTKYKKGNWAGKIYGWPILRWAWCSSMLKLAALRTYQKQLGEYAEIVGIAADEIKRIPRALKKGQILPLVDYGITEAEAFKICQREGLLSPAYTKATRRLGCWFCHNQRIGELRHLRHAYPDLWELLLTLDNDSELKFKPDWTVKQLDQRFTEEDKQICLFEAVM